MNQTDFNLEEYKSNIIKKFEYFIENSILPDNTKNTIKNKFRKEMNSSDNKKKIDRNYKFYKKIFFEALLNYLKLKDKLDIKISKENYELDFNEFYDLLKSKILEIINDVLKDKKDEEKDEYLDNERNRLKAEINSINLSLSFSEFYELINNKIEEFFNDKIEEIINPYIQISDYCYFKEKIEKLIDNFKLSINMLDLNNIHIIDLDKNIELLKKLIDNINNLFFDYYKNIESLIKLYKKTNNLSIKKKILKLIKEYQENLSIPIEKHIDEIELEISNENQLNYLQDIKTKVFNQCEIKTYDNMQILYLNGKIVGYYFKDTDTLNIILELEEKNIISNQNFMWLSFSSKFNVLDDGKYQESTAVWLTKGNEGYTPNLYFNNMLLSLYEVSLDLNDLDFLGICQKDNDKISINLLGYEIDFDYQDDPDFPDINPNMAILSKYGNKNSDNNKFSTYLKNYLNWEYEHSLEIPDDDYLANIKKFIENMATKTNHGEISNIIIRPENQKIKTL